ncbi:Zn-ribbon domain-containing OB-fold protein [Streptomyces sp. NPDC018833]|uniref:Zn-ribbon domain-containing OB-fold protein n=1 Tax=Streptomyces sp. NPDC018833 TaxID=3365053 RepID=UPI00378BAAAA
MFYPAIETTIGDPLRGSGVSSAVPALPGDWDDPGRVPPDGVRGGELYFQRCRWCRTAAFRRLLCPVCASTDLAWERSAGTGVVRHLAVVGRNTGTPQVLAIIDMREGFWLRSRVIGVSPGTVRVGAVVRLAVDGGPGPQELAFRLGDVPPRC